MFEHIEEALDARGYFHPPEKKPKMIDNLRAVLSRRAFSEQEISVFRGVINSLDRFPRQWPKKTVPRQKKASEAGETEGNDSGE